MKGTTEQLNELRELVTKVTAHQGRTPDNVWCNRYRQYVGTTRTWRDRLCAGQFDQVDVPRRIASLQELISFLEGGAIPEQLYPDLPFNRRFQIGLERLEGQRSTDRRIFCVLAGIGVGKTVACRLALREQHAADYQGPKRISLIIPEALRENKTGLLGYIAHALNCGGQAVTSPALMEAIKGALSQDVTLIFDEAHQGGVMLMRIIKDLVNHTPARFVYVALQTEYLRVVSASKGNITEAKQFVRRCMQPVFAGYAGGTLAIVPQAGGKDADGDAALYIQYRTGLEKPAARRLAAEKLSALRAAGNLSSLADALDKAQLEADDEEREVDAESVAQAIDSVCGGKVGL